MRPFGMARDQRLAPGIKLAIKIAQHLLGLAVQRRGLLFQIDPLALAGQRAQLLGLALQVGKRLFELEIGHQRLRAVRRGWATI
jgi:hypothetical protein